MIIVRILLISLIVYLLMRSFFKFDQDNKSKSKLDTPEDRVKSENRKISKEVGEYVDYEEIKDDNH